MTDIPINEKIDEVLELAGQCLVEGRVRMAIARYRADDLGEYVQVVGEALQQVVWLFETERGRFGWLCSTNYAHPFEGRVPIEFCVESKRGAVATTQYLLWIMAGS